MKVCYKNGEVNLNYHNIYGEEKAINDGYILCDIPDEIKDFCPSDFDDNGFNIDKYNARKNKDVLQKELLELQNWFVEYDNQVKQFQRYQRLGIEFDKDINELDNQAKANQEHIREIRRLLN